MENLNEINYQHPSGQSHLTKLIDGLKEVLYLHALARYSSCVDPVGIDGEDIKERLDMCCVKYLSIAICTLERYRMEAERDAFIDDMLERSFPKQGIEVTEDGNVPGVSEKKKNRKQVSDKERMKLFEELKHNGYKGLFSGRVIKKSDVVNHDLITVEHIIPLGQGGKDDLANMTLEYKDENQKKGERMPLVYMNNKGKSFLKQYRTNVQKLYNKKSITKEKYKNFYQIKSKKK